MKKYRDKKRFGFFYNFFYKKGNKNGAVGRIRTHDLRLRRPSLYPAELLPHGSKLLNHSSVMAVGVRFELTIEILVPILT